MAGEMKEVREALREAVRKHRTDCTNLIILISGGFFDRLLHDKEAKYCVNVSVNTILGIDYFIVYSKYIPTVAFFKK